MALVVWLAVCEILVEPGDLPSGATKAFVRVSTWADTVEMLREKASQYLQRFHWRLLSVEEAGPVDGMRAYDDEIADMIARTRENPKAIILGEFFSYKEN